MLYLQIDFVNAPLDFPSVSLCNINPIRASEIGKVPEIKEIIDEIAAKKENKSRPPPGSNKNGSDDSYGYSQYSSDYYDSVCILF